MATSILAKTQQQATSMSYYRLLLILVIGSLLSSCNEADTSSLARQPLIVDLTAVAHAIGRDEEINKKLEEARTSLNDQLKEIGATLENTLKEKKAELDKNATDKNKAEQKASEDELQQLTLQAQLKLKQTQQLAEQKATQYRSSLLNEFRLEVKNIAQNIATKRGATEVRIATINDLWYDSKIDITEDVISVLRSQPAEKTSKEADATEDTPAQNNNENSE